MDYAVIQYEDVPPFIPFRYKGKWWSRHTQNEIRTVNNNPDASKKTVSVEFSVISRYALVAIALMLLPCQSERKVVRKFHVPNI